MKVIIDIPDVDFKSVKMYKDFRFIPFPVLDSVIRSVQNGTPTETAKETKMNKEGFINDITRKMCSGIQLEASEIGMVVRALRESNNYLQKPYYEVIYHDKYDNTETRIMEPIASRKVEMKDYSVQEDRFNLNFRRIIREGDE